MFVHTDRGEDKKARIAFLPQSAYFPKGTLREALKYPVDSHEEEHSPARNS